MRRITGASAGYPMLVQLNDLDHGRLRRLAALRPTGAPVLSVYVDLDPTEFATQRARTVQIGSLLDEAERRVREAELERQARIGLREDLERVRAAVRGNGNGGPAKGAHALAIFACQPAGVFELLRLPEAVPGMVALEELPYLDPLVGRERPRRCLALVSRRTLRALVDDAAGELREVTGIVDDVHGQHDQGGWSQARYERGIEEEVRRHLERSAGALRALQRRRPFDLLAVGATPELFPALERELHPTSRERLVGRFDVDVEHATAEQALAAARPLLEAAEERRAQELLGSLRARYARGERVAVGLAPVLEALSERRAEALLYDERFEEPGYVCLETGWVGADAGGCPTGPERAQRQANVRDAAISAALLQSAELLALHGRDELKPLGGIAALLRF
jgi:peptide chain release factor subunit 1